MHPSSVCFKARHYRYPYLVYNTKIRTSKPFIRDATMVQPYALLLFGGASAESIEVRPQM
jgi:hypothetical protein